MILTDGIILTTTGILKPLHAAAQKAGIKKSNYAKPYYKIPKSQVRAVLALGAKVVSTFEVTEVVNNYTQYRKCKS
jgi:hypothetical protein